MGISSWGLIDNIGSDNGLLPSGNRSLPEMMLFKICDAIWHSQATQS